MASPTDSQTQPQDLSQLSRISRSTLAEKKNHETSVDMAPPANVKASTSHQRRTFTGNSYPRSVVGASILLLLVLCCAYLSFTSGHNGPLLHTMDARGFEHLRSHCASIPPIAASEFHKRQTDLARVLHSLNASAYIAEPGANALYFGNISGNDWHLSERPLLLIISPARTSGGEIEPRVTILHPKFETTRAKMLPVPASNVTYVEWAEEEDPYVAAVSSFSAHAARDSTIFISESSRLFIPDGIQAAAPDAKVVSAPLAVRTLRERKSEAEMVLLRCVNEVTLLAIRAVRDKMHIGISDSDTRKLVIDALTSAGLENPTAIVLFGEDAALPHGGGTGRILRAEDFILLDIGGTLNGYNSDVTRTFALAESIIPIVHLEIWNTVAVAQFMALVAARDSIPTHVVDETARKYLARAGYGPYFTHRLGHGIGLEGHEAPYLRGGSNDIIRKGHSFSNEPGVYIEGKVGVRLEDCFEITQYGRAEYFTQGVGGAARSPWDP